MYFLRGNLPWQGLKIKTKDNRYQKILDKKKETSSDELCKNFPIEFKQYIDYTRNLEYDENPNYDKLRNNFYNLLTKKLNEKFDYIYDWTTKGDLKKRKDNNILLEKDNNINEKERVNNSCLENSKNKSCEFNESKDNKEINKNKKYDNDNKKKLKNEEEDDDDDEDEIGKNKIKSKCCLM